MGYWSGIAKRAIKAAAKDVRIDSAPALAALVVGQAVLALALYSAVGLTGANLLTRVLTAILPFLILPIFFAYRMVTAPAAFDRERLGEIAELGKALEDQREALTGGELAKRHRELTGLRKLYILSHDGLTTELMAGWEWPPVEWLNQQLDNRGLPWRVERTDGDAVLTRSIEG